MADIVERLRVPCFEHGLDEGWIDAQRREAADEITRLRAALREIIQSAERSARNVAFRKRINFYATPLNEAWDGGALETHNILADIARAALEGK